MVGLIRAIRNLNSYTSQKKSERVTRISTCFKLSQVMVSIFKRHVHTCGVDCIVFVYIVIEKYPQMNFEGRNYWFTNVATQDSCKGLHLLRIELRSSV